MNNINDKKIILTFFALSAYFSALIGLILLFFLNKYDHKKDVLVSKKENVFITINHNVHLNLDDYLVMSDNTTQNIQIEIKDNDIDAKKVILTVIDPDQNIIKNIANLKYDEKYQGYDITGFNGTIIIKNNYPKSTSNDWQAKISYIDYLGFKVITPHIMVN